VVALDDHRKLQLAADRLNISQSAASKMLAEIEAVAGASLSASPEASSPRRKAGS
jgi:DNA-binding transcriptional LysR family regulator